MDQPSSSRRQFMAAIGNLASAGWVAMNWPQIAQAAAPMHHGDPMAHMKMSGPAPKPVFKTLTPAEAAEVDAIASQIVPGGASPGAHEAHAVYFIDNALGSFWAAQLPAFRSGMAAFDAAWAAKAAAGPFSAAPSDQQIAFLHEVDKTPYFLAVRRLTVLGMLAWPQYGGNFEGIGSKLIGVEDRHVWSPPFGYYDRDYPGFEAYPGHPTYKA